MSLRILIVVAILAGLASAAPVPKELKNRPDEERIQGLWAFELYDMGGKEAKGTRWYFEKDKMYSGGLNTTDNKGAMYTIALRTEMRPAEMDILVNETIICRGIYEFAGDDLRIAYYQGPQRPTDYSSAPGKAVIVMKRSRESAK